jgi:TetR/AcrR family transcriptional regulator, regulator of cefoperazone and chloramphenicol sensitivity
MRARSRTLSRPRRRARPRVQDHETRRRLLETAAELFADEGFHGVTVREICRAARANLAAVNYHFGDKLGLYAEVVQAAIDAMRETGAAAMRSDGTPEQRLRTFIGVHLERLVGKGQGSWIHRLMNREMEAPTPELDRVVEQGIRPRIAYLSGVVAEAMGCPLDDQRVARVVGSIQGQFLIYARNPILTRLMPGWRPTPESLAQLADHIAEFSLAGMRGLAEAVRPSEDPVVRP